MCVLYMFVLYTYFVVLDQMVVPWHAHCMLIACSLHVVGKLTLAILLRVTNNESGQQFLAVLYI